MNVLWYKSPATDSGKAFYIGNGRIGAEVFGNPFSEEIVLSEESVWSGAHYTRINPSSKENIGRVLSLFAKKNEGEAKRLAQETMLSLPERGACLLEAGRLCIDFFLPGQNEPNIDELLLYKRELDLETAVASSSFSVESSEPSTAYLSRNTRGSSITYTTEVFVSTVADVLAFHISASTPKSVSLRATLRAEGNAGRIFAHEDSIVLESAHGIPYCIMATAVSFGGSIKTRGAHLVVENADEVTLYVDVHSAYRSSTYRHRGGNVYKNYLPWCEDEALKKLCFVTGAPYSANKASHIASYSRLYKNGSFLRSLETVEAPSVALDELLEKNTPCKKELLWNYSHYLFISKCGLASSLPCIYQKTGSLYKTESPFDYSLETLSSCYSAGLLLAKEKLFAPFFEFMRGVAKSGRKTAEKMYGFTGYVLHSGLDIWKDTAPYGKNVEKACEPFGASYIATLVWEYYEYTLNKKFLKKHFCLLSEATEFFCQYIEKFGLCFVLQKTPSLHLLLALFEATDKAFCVLGIAETASEVIKVRATLKKIKAAAKDFSTEDAVESDLYEALPQMDRAALFVQNTAQCIAKSTLVSDHTEVELLPNLLQTMEEGSIRNMPLKGNLRLDMDWKSGKPCMAKIYAKREEQSVNSVVVIFNKKSYDAPLTDGKIDVLNVLPSVL